MARVKLTDKELEEHFNEQMSLLKASIENFDNGNEAEAKRIAISLRIFLNDTKNQKSLLSQMGKKSVKFLDSSHKFDTKNLGSHSGLTNLALGNKNSKQLHFAPLDDSISTNLLWLDFSEWWEQIIVSDKDKNLFSRRDIVLIVSDQDGGAHIDNSVDKNYYNLKNNNSLNWHKVEGNKEEPAEGPEKAIIRQIAHEFLKSIEPSYKKMPSIETGIILGGMSITVSENKPVKKIKLGRNEICPCGSGKKFKKCHGINNVYWTG